MIPVAHQGFIAVRTWKMPSLDMIDIAITSIGSIAFFCIIVKDYLKYSLNNFQKDEDWRGFVGSHEETSHPIPGHKFFAYRHQTHGLNGHRLFVQSLLCISRYFNIFSISLNKDSNTSFLKECPLIDSSMKYVIPQFLHPKPSDFRPKNLAFLKTSSK